MLSSAAVHERWGGGSMFFSIHSYTTEKRFYDFTLGLFENACLTIAHLRRLLRKYTLLLNSPCSLTTLSVKEEHPPSISTTNYLLCYFSASNIYIFVVIVARVSYLSRRFGKIFILRVLNV